MQHKHLSRECRHLRVVHCRQKHSLLGFGQAVAATCGKASVSFVFCCFNVNITISAYLIATFCMQQADEQVFCSKCQACQRDRDTEMWLQHVARCGLRRLLRLATFIFHLSEQTLATKSALI